MILEGKIVRQLAEGPIPPPGEQLGLQQRNSLGGEWGTLQSFKTFDQLLLALEGKKVRITIEEVTDANLGAKQGDPAKE